MIWKDAFSVGIENNRTNVYPDDWQTYWSVHAKIISCVWLIFWQTAGQGPPIHVDIRTILRPNADSDFSTRYSKVKPRSLIQRRIIQLILHLFRIFLYTKIDLKLTPTRIAELFVYFYNPLHAKLAKPSAPKIGIKCRSIAWTFLIHWINNVYDQNICQNSVSVSVCVNDVLKIQD